MFLFMVFCTYLLANFLKKCLLHIHSKAKPVKLRFEKYWLEIC
jgi:hypothetical protein